MGMTLVPPYPHLYIGKGIILQEPSVIAIDQNDKVPLAVGDEAKKNDGTNA